MRSTASLLLVGTLLLTGCIASVGEGPRPSSDSKKLTWEYKQDTVCVAGQMPGGVHDIHLASILDQRGREGWELVSINPSSSGTETCYLLIFKRPKVV